MRMWRVAAGETEHTQSQEWEASFLLRHAYPIHEATPND